MKCRNIDRTHMKKLKMSFEPFRILFNYILVKISIFKTIFFLLFKLDRFWIQLSINSFCWTFFQDFSFIIPMLDNNWNIKIVLGRKRKIHPCFLGSGSELIVVCLHRYCHWHLRKKYFYNFLKNFFIKYSKNNSLFVFIQITTLKIHNNKRFTLLSHACVCVWMFWFENKFQPSIWWDASQQQVLPLISIATLLSASD